MNFSKQVRKTLMKIYGHLYSRHIYEDDSRCFYCGDYRTGFDHVPPLFVVDGVTTAVLRRMEIPLVLVSCCTNCNSLLGAKRIATTMERTCHLYSRLTAQYEKSVALWSPEELLEMSDMFRKMIKARNRMNVQLLFRIRNLEKRMLDHDSHPKIDTSK